MANEERAVSEMTEEEVLSYVQGLRAQREKRRLEAEEVKKKKIAEKSPAPKENEATGAVLDIMRSILGDNVTG